MNVEEIFEIFDMTSQKLYLLAKEQASRGHHKILELKSILLRYTANVFAVKFTGFPCVPLEPCKVHVFITAKWFQVNPC